MVAPLTPDITHVCARNLPLEHNTHPHSYKAWHTGCMPALGGQTPLTNFWAEQQRKGGLRVIREGLAGGRGGGACCPCCAHGAAG